MVGLGHRAFDLDRERHGVAVVDERRQVELDPAGPHRVVADDLADRLVQRLLADLADVGGQLSMGGTGSQTEKQESAPADHFRVTRKATTSSICCAVSTLLPR